MGAGPGLPLKGLLLWGPGLRSPGFFSPFPGPDASLRDEAKAPACDLVPAVFFLPADVLYMSSFNVYASSVNNEEAVLFSAVFKARMEYLDICMGHCPAEHREKKSPVTPETSVLQEKACLVDFFCRVR